MSLDSKVTGITISMVLLTRQLSNLDKILTYYNNWRFYITGQIWKISTQARAWVHYTVYLEQSLPVAKRHLEMGFPPASQQCAAYIPRVPKEKIVRYAVCLQKNRCAYVAHINLRNIKRAQNHFPLSEEDVWLDAWRGGMLERDIDGEVSIDVKSSHLFRCN